MNRFLPPIFAFLVVATTLTQAQNSIEYSTGQQVRIYSPGFTPYKGVEGTPYLPGDTAQMGWLMNGTKQIPARLRYNAYTGEVEYVEGDRILTPANSITGFTILASDRCIFAEVFPLLSHGCRVIFTRFFSMAGKLNFFGTFTLTFGVTPMP